MPACPICTSAAETPSENPYFPFCSRRCRTIDLANWLDAAYRLDDAAPPVPAPRGDEGGSATPRRRQA